MPEDYPVGKFYALLAEAFNKFGGDIHIVNRLPDMMREAGFVHVQQHVMKIPIG